jgi:hypothetical protein
MNNLNEKRFGHALLLTQKLTAEMMSFLCCHAERVELVLEDVSVRQAHADDDLQDSLRGSTE